MITNSPDLPVSRPGPGFMPPVSGIGIGSKPTAGEGGEAQGSEGPPPQCPQHQNLTRVPTVLT